MKLTVKGKRVELNGNKMSGDTYPIKGYIKEYLNGKWDADNKVWIVDGGQVEAMMTGQYPVIKLDTSTTEQVTEKAYNGLCPKCHTWCYGDCTAH
ncbi:hypothetical protein SY88_23755 [Clostridiales bacterium PH28_bin88]|nr:hypothetical protein SY88_23755 [Clostridiales bacterium PH28_bin88]